MGERHSRGISSRRTLRDPAGSRRRALGLVLPALLLPALWVGGAQDCPAGDAPSGGEVALDKFFHGAVAGLEGTKVRLRYDFSSADQLKDWVEGVPWPIAKDAPDGIGVSEGRLAVRGSVGARHVAEWDGDLVVTAKLIPESVKDIGSYLSSSEMPNDYVSYTIGETYFHGWDHEGSGGDTGMMKFGKQFSAVQKGGFVGFRYLAFRRPPTDPAPGKAISWAFGRDAGKLLLTMDDLKLDSVEPANRLKSVSPGFYAIKGSMIVDDVTIEGTLSPKFLAAKKIALRTENPVLADAAAGLDPAVVALVDAYKKGSESATKLVSIVGDAARAEPDRAAATQALKAGPHKALPAVVDLLYSPDVKARAHGIDIVKAITGKNYGYDPRGGEKSRQTAVRKLNEDMTAHPELLQGGGG